MVYFAGLLTTTILLALSALHLYWAFGGQWGAIASVLSIEGNLSNR